MECCVWGQDGDLVPGPLQMIKQFGRQDGGITSTKDEDLGSPLDQLSWGDKMESSTDLIMFEGQLAMLTSGA